MLMVSFLYMHPQPSGEGIMATLDSASWFIFQLLVHKIVGSDCLSIIIQLTKMHREGSSIATTSYRYPPTFGKSLLL